MYFTRISINILLWIKDTILTVKIKYNILIIFNRWERAYWIYNQRICDIQCKILKQAKFDWNKIFIQGWNLLRYVMPNWTNQLTLDWLNFSVADCWSKIKGTKEGGMRTGTASLLREKRYSKNRSVCKNAVT